MDLVWQWIAAHPADSAWIAFGLLSAFVAAYKMAEHRIKAFVLSTETTADDRFVRLIDVLVSVFEVLRLFVPYGLARPRLNHADEIAALDQERKERKSEPPPPSTPTSP